LTDRSRAGRAASPHLGWCQPTRGAATLHGCRDSPPHHPKPMADIRDSAAPHVAADPDLVEYLMLVVPELSSMSGLALALVETVESAAIRILDLVCVTRSENDGSLTVLEFEDVAAMAALQYSEGEVGGMLSDHDIETASLAVEPGSSAILLLVEDRWAESLSKAARRAGGRVAGGERIRRSRFESALEALRAERGPTKSLAWERD
jgi:hypothetical protein